MIGVLETERGTHTRGRWRIPATSGSQEESKGGVPYRFPKGRGPADILILDFWPQKHETIISVVRSHLGCGILLRKP